MSCCVFPFDADVDVNDSQVMAEKNIKNILLSRFVGW